MSEVLTTDQQTPFDKYAHTFTHLSLRTCHILLSLVIWFI